MSKSNISVYGIYANRLAAESTVTALREVGFRDSDISILSSDERSLKQLATQKETKAPEGAAIGVALGGVVGGTLGWLAGIGVLALPALGPLIAAGPITAFLAGLGIGGTVGAITGWLVGMAFPEYEARRYDGMVREGGVLLSVHCDSSSWGKRAKKVLEWTGARDISSSAEAKANVKVDEQDFPVRRTG